MTSLLEQLPKIVADGKREAERIMARLFDTARLCAFSGAIVGFLIGVLL